MFPQGVIRVISVDEQPLFLTAIQHQFQNLPGFDLTATSTTLTDIELLIQRYQPHVAIVESPFSPPIENTEPETASLVQVLRRLQISVGPKILILASRLDPTLILNLDTLNIRGYLLKQDPLTLHLPDIVRMIAFGSFIYSEEILRAKNVLLEHASNGILTPRQLEVLNAIVKDPNSSYAQYAEQLGITESTWDSHLCNIYNRLGVNTITAAILRAVELGLISLCHVCPNTPYRLGINQPGSQKTNLEL